MVAKDVLLLDQATVFVQSVVVLSDQRQVAVKGSVALALMLGEFGVTVILESVGLVAPPPFPPAPD
jgi:hypothetical protein